MPPSVVIVDVANAATDYGVDVDCLSGIGYVLGLASGYTVVANAIGRRLITPRGGLFYDLDYGFDVRSYCNAALTRGKMAELIAGVESECAKDERVQSARASIQATGFPDVSLAIRLDVELAAGGGFTAIMSISDLVAAGAAIAA